MKKFEISGATVELWYDGKDYSPDDQAYRQRYAYRITADGWEYVGNDIRSGCGAAVDEDEMARTLFAFLGACAESRAYGGGENSDLFPDHVGAWAEANSDEIDMLSLDPADLQ